MPNENVLADDFARSAGVPTHILQTKCQRAAELLSAGIKNGCAVTVIAFYKDISATGWGFASSLPDHDAVLLTIEATIARKCGAPLLPRDPNIWLPVDADVKVMAELCRDALPFSCGFVLLLGAGVDSVYASFEEAPRMLDFLSHVVLPQFKAQQAVSRQPESA